jgi:hypothetical protein
VSFALLLVALVSVVGLAKRLSPAIERAVDAAGAPKAAIGIVIAMLVLLPEAWAAARAARADRLQTSMNLAIGSALACIGLTVPVVVVSAIAFDLPWFWAGSQGHRVAHADIPRERSHPGNRPYAHDEGRRAPRDLRGVPLFSRRELERQATAPSG